jgi:DNA (cytosine-5)-methyltransferase 1
MYRVPLLSEIRKLPKNDINIISLFAGGGGSSCGYHMAGANVLLANEFVDIAADTYSANWPETIMIRDDIRTLNPIDILKKVNLSVGELDILEGSPPCCNFSVAGKRDKGWRQEKVYSDNKVVKNIEDLFYEYIRFVDVMKPKVFIAENVKGLIVGHSKGYFNIILRGLKAIGYHVEARLLNSVFLGVPQIRERVIFIGVRNDIMKKCYINNLHPKPINKIVSLKEAFETLKYNKNEVDFLSEEIKKYSVYKYLLKTDKGKYYSKEKYYMLLKADPNLPSFTITATMKVHQSSVKHWDNRPFTIGELKRITSLPDDYKLLGSYEKQAERIGRMVPPLVSKAILVNLMEKGILK